MTEGKQSQLLVLGLRLEFDNTLYTIHHTMECHTEARLLCEDLIPGLVMSLDNKANPAQLG